MAVLNFPSTRPDNSPLQPGDQYISDVGVTYVWDGVKWTGHISATSGASNKIYNGTSYANIAALDGNLVVNINSNEWTFNPDGSMVFPDLGDVTNAAIAYVAADEISFGTSTGNISIWPGNGHWIFDTTGNLTLPSGGRIDSANGYIDVRQQGGGVNLLSDTYVQMQYSSDFANTDPYSTVDTNWIFVDSNGFTITNNATGTNSYWVFDNSGNITLPSNTSAINYANGVSILSGLSGGYGATGPQGSAGPQGSSGATGPQGSAGANGSTGPTGPQGNIGPQGPQGYQGDPGATGAQGNMGATGLQGPAGSDGTSVRIVDSVPDASELAGYNTSGLQPGDGIIQEDTGHLQVWSGSSFTDVGQIKGDAGATGPQGNPGPTGPTGPQGNIGPQGFQGNPGPTGPQGNPGPTGPQGDTGPTGPTGNDGNPGADGATGPQGNDGAPGATGPTGNGVPTGGMAGQVLTKVDSTDYNTEWIYQSNLTNNSYTATFNNDGSFTIPSVLYSSGINITGQVVLPSTGVASGIVTSNGLGNVYFETDNSLNVIVNNNWQYVFNADGTVAFGGGYIFPNTAGTSGQVLVYNPSGSGEHDLQWQDQAGSGAIGATGPQGDTGPTGPTGPAGNDGNPGADGATGPQGPAGNDGNPGMDGATGSRGSQWFSGTVDPLSSISGIQDQDFYFKTTDNSVWQYSAGIATWYLLSNINGATGPQGDIGATGPQGNTGPTGPTGNDGNPGADGATGPQGDTGPTGPTGNDGNPGADGATGPQGPNSTVSDTQPNTGTGTFWYDTNDGRTYIYTGSTWADASPTVITPASVYLGNLSVTDRTIYSDTVGWTFGADGTLELPSGNTRLGTVMGSDAIIANSNTTFGVIAQGTSGSAALVWVEDSENFVTSNIAAVYTNFTGLGTVRIATGANPDPKFWDFGRDGTLTTPGNVYVTGNLIIQGNTYQEDRELFVSAAGEAIEFANGGNIFAPAGLGNVIVSTNHSQYNWTFGTDGELYLPSNGRLGFAGKGWTGLDGGPGNPTSLTSLYSSGMYSSCITLNPDGSLNISTYGDGTGQLGNWNFNGNVLTVAGPVQSNNDLVLSSSGGDYNWILGNDASTTIPGGWKITESRITAAVDNGRNGPPGTTTADGSRFVLYDGAATGNYSYALGMEANAMWLGVPDSHGAESFNFYGAGTRMMSLSSNGHLTLGNSAVSTYTLPNTDGRGYQTIVTLGDGVATWANIVTVDNSTPGDQTLWYNTEDGRLYVFAHGIWVDASPAVIPPPSTYLGNLYVENDTIYYSANGISILDGVGSTYSNANVTSYLSEFDSTIKWTASGFNPPRFNTSSTGTKIILFPQVDSSNVDYAIGIDTATLWQSIPQNNNGYQFKWYAGTTEIAKLDGVGNLTLDSGSLNFTSSSTSITGVGSISTNNVYVSNTVTTDHIATTVSAGEQQTTTGSRTVITGDHWPAVFSGNNVVYTAYTDTIGFRMTVKAETGSTELEMADIMVARNALGNVVYTVSNRIKTDPTAPDVVYTAVNNSGVLQLYAQTGANSMYFTYSVTEFKKIND